MKLIMSRHAETITNTQRKFAGWTDSPLTAAGIKAANELAEYLKNVAIDVAVCSTTQRARKTCEIALKYQQVEVLYYDEFRELNFGDWEGVSLSSLEDDPLTYYFFNEPDKFTAPNGENLLELLQRSLGKVNDLFRDYPDKTVFLMSHGLTIRNLNNYFYGNPISMLRAKTKFLHSCSISVIDYRSPRDFAVVLEGDTSFLSAEVG